MRIVGDNDWPPIPRPKVEPTAEQRAAGVQMFGLHTAFLDAGFTEAQSLQLIGVAVAAMLNNRPGEPQ